MSDVPGTSTTGAAPSPSTPPTADAAALRTAFPSMATEPAPAPPAADPEEAKWRAAFPSMYPPSDTPTDPQRAPGATADAPADADGATAGRTVTFRDVGEVTIPSAAHLNDGDLSALADAARELHLDAPATQRLLDMHAQATENLTTAADAAWTDTKREWRETVERDPEIGGAALKANVAVARGVIERFGSPALRQALNETGLGNHPELVRLMVRVGKALDAQARPASEPVRDEDAAMRAAFPSMYQAR